MSARKVILKPVNFLSTKASNSVARLPKGPLAASIAAAEASGEDLTKSVHCEYWCAQRQLTKYRVEKFWQEFNHLAEGNYGLANMGLFEWVYFVRFCTKVMFTFLVGYLLARGSVYPFLTPGSPINITLNHINPNCIEPHYYSNHAALRKQ